MPGSALRPRPGTPPLRPKVRGRADHGPPARRIPVPRRPREGLSAHGGRDARGAGADGLCPASVPGRRRPVRAGGVRRRCGVPRPVARPVPLRRSRPPAGAPRRADRRGRAAAVRRGPGPRGSRRRSRKSCWCWRPDCRGSHGNTLVLPTPWSSNMWGWFFRRCTWPPRRWAWLPVPSDSAIPTCSPRPRAWTTTPKRRSANSSSEVRPPMRNGKEGKIRHWTEDISRTRSTGEVVPATDRFVGGRHQACRGVSPLIYILEDGS